MNIREDLFWIKVDKSGECWEWTASKSRNGYGQFAGRGTMLIAHRVAYELENGSIPEGMVIDHLCHRISCVRPSHLQAVTQKQNVENHSGAQSNSKTGIRGVRQRTAGCWEARVNHHGATLYTGYFQSIEEAEAAVIAKRNELFSNNLADRISA